MFVVTNTRLIERLRNKSRLLVTRDGSRMVVEAGTDVELEHWFIPGGGFLCTLIGFAMALGRAQPGENPANRMFSGLLIGSISCIITILCYVLLARFYVTRKFLILDRNNRMLRVFIEYFGEKDKIIIEVPFRSIKCFKNEKRLGGKYRGYYYQFSVEIFDRKPFVLYKLSFYDGWDLKEELSQFLQ
jgi:hypothetical protein